MAQFGKQEFVRRVLDLMSDIGIDRQDIVNATDYKKRTLDRHLDLSNDQQPRMSDLAQLCLVLNTSMDYLTLGRGVRYVSEFEREEMYQMIERYASDKSPENVIIGRTIVKLPKYIREILADVCTRYESKF